jgi:hypothetical protein
MTRGHAQVAVALAIASVLTSGCTDDSGPGTQPLPTVEVTATKTATATRTPAATTFETRSAAPVTPSTTTPTIKSTPSDTSTAGTDPRASVEAFIRNYYEATNLAAATGDTAQMRAMMTTTCVCRDAARYFEEEWEEGSLSGFNARPVKIVADVPTGNEARAIVTLEIARYKVLDANGKTLSTEPAERLVELETMVKRGNRWLMANVSKVDS